VQGYQRKDTFVCASPNFVVAQNAISPSGKLIGYEIGVGVEQESPPSGGLYSCGSYGAGDDVCG